jgi:hypothetical protein
VFCTACDSAAIAFIVFYIQSGKQRKVGWLGDDSHLVFGQKLHDGKGNERRCVIVMQQPFLLSPKFWVKSSNIFKQSLYIVRIVRGMYCLISQDEFFVNNSFDARDNYEHALDFAIYFLLGRLLVCLMVKTVNSTLVISHNHRQEGCIVGGDLTKLLADVDTLLLLISCQKSHQARCTTPNKRTLKQARPVSCVKFYTLTPNICWYYRLPLHRATTAVQMAAYQSLKLWAVPRNSLAIEESLV